MIATEVSLQDVSAQHVTYQRRLKHLFHGKSSTSLRCSSKVRRKRQTASNATIDSKTHIKKSSSRLFNLNKKLHKFQKPRIMTSNQLTCLKALSEQVSRK